MSTENKVAIITIQGLFNYGNRLQNYATSELYKSLGYQPVSLILDRRKSTERLVKDMVKKLIGKSNIPREQLMSKERLSAFSDFNKHLEFEHVYKLDQPLIDRYNWFSVGSDQIWGIYRRPCDEDWRFLEFVPPEKRIALAPSIGLDELGNRERRILKRYISSYRKISIREYQGAKLVFEATGKLPDVICDPTMALRAKEWRRVANSSLTPDAPYIFTYMLGDMSASAKYLISHLGYGKKIVSLSDSERPGEVAAGPAEFISLIDNADLVITDSFHASLFSALLESPLVILRRSGGSSMYGRLVGLAESIGIENKLYDSPLYDEKRLGDYSGVAASIEEQRNKFMDYLNGCLDA